jgi:hypothetical protein
MNNDQNTRDEELAQVEIDTDERLTVEVPSEIRAGLIVNSPGGYPTCCSVLA